MALNWTPKQFELARAEDLAVVATLASSRPWIVSGLVLSAGTGLNVAISAGDAWINGYYVSWDAATEEAVTADATNHVWIELTRDGNDNVTAVAFVVNTTGTPPSGDFVKLGTAIADGSAVTSTATTGRSPQTQIDVEIVAAEDVTYDNATSGLVATEVQAAIDELAGAVGGDGWTAIAGISADVSRTNNTQTTVYSIALEANKTYLFECDIVVSGATGSMSFDVPSGATINGNFIGMTEGGNDENWSFPFSRNNHSLNWTSTFSQIQYTSETTTHIKISGTIVTSGTAGDCNVRFANGGSGTLIVEMGSNIKIKDVT